MIRDVELQEQALHALSSAVADAVTLFAATDAALFDGQQTAHDALARLVFWMCEHVGVAKALLAGAKPALKRGTLAALSHTACTQMGGESMDELACRLQQLHEQLDSLLRQIPSWDVDFPIKQGGRASTVADRIGALAASIRGELALLRQAALVIKPVTVTRRSLN